MKLHYTETRLLQETLEKAMEEQTLEEAEKLLLVARKLEIHTLVMINTVHEIKNKIPF